MILAIDPGVRAIGYAFGDVERGLVRCGALRDTRKGVRVSDAARLYVAHVRALCGLHRLTVDRTVVESMQWDGRRTTTPQDLIDVQTVGCVLAGAFGDEFALVKPQGWKGSTSKDHDHHRTRAVLSPAEARVLDTALARTSAKHAKEVLDAVGILMYGLGRR